MTLAVPRLRFEVLELARYNRTTRCIYIPLSSEDGISSPCWAARGFEGVAISFESRYRALMSCRWVLSWSYLAQIGGHVLTCHFRGYVQLHFLLLVKVMVQDSSRKSARVVTSVGV